MPSRQFGCVRRIASTLIILCSVVPNWISRQSVSVISDYLSIRARWRRLQRRPAFPTDHVSTTADVIAVRGKAVATIGTRAAHPLRPWGWLGRSVGHLSRRLHGAVRVPPEAFRARRACDEGRAGWWDIGHDAASGFKSSGFIGCHVAMAESY